MSQAPLAGSYLPLDPVVRTKLSVMMLLQYFVWGAWYVTMSGYILANTGQEKMFASGFTGTAYGAAAIAAMIAPFFVGMIADRFFSTERMLAVLHLGGAGVLYYLSTTNTQGLFHAALIGYFLAYMPTLALTNSLSFHHMSDPARQFPGIRVLGAIGWIIGGQLVGRLVIDGKSIESTVYPMQIAAAAQAALGLFCLVLPHTPPKNAGGKVSIGAILGLDALRLMRRPAFAVFVVGSFLIAIPLQFYYAYAQGFLNAIGVENAAGKMTYGQMTEVAFMIIMPFFFARLGVKYMLLVGMACWTARYFLFAYGDAGDGMWMLYIAILLHGICYDFFFVTGQIYVDQEADEKIRGAAQGFLAFATLGVGLYIGSLVASATEVHYRSGDSINWQSFWTVPAIGAGVVLVLFALAFHDKKGNGPVARP